MASAIGNSEKSLPTDNREKIAIVLKVDGIVFETQYLALFGIAKIREMNVDYPYEVSMASFGDPKVFSIFRPKVTALVLPVDSIVQCSIDILMRQIKEKHSNDLKLHEIIQPTLEVRET
ncbi:MAG: substrate-binding domain-containing protein [Cytophagales bacterium]|nr:substrate-binding domain-containing protein [Cytophagales bacterium]